MVARGDGGKSVFENDPDRFGWLDLLERACDRFGRDRKSHGQAGTKARYEDHVVVVTPQKNERTQSGLEPLLSPEQVVGREKQDYFPRKFMLAAVQKKWLAYRCPVFHAANLQKKNLSTAACFSVLNS